MFRLKYFGNFKICKENEISFLIRFLCLRTCNLLLSVLLLIPTDGPLRQKHVVYLKLKRIANCVVTVGLCITF